MIRSIDAYKAFGKPDVKFERKHMTVWDVPTELEIGQVPKKLYCNKRMVEPLAKAFKNLIDRGFVSQLKTFDGCFNNRPMRGYEATYNRFANAGNDEKAAAYLSLHSWGLAIDVNAAWNGLGKEPTLKAGFVKCFTDAGFEWGGNWQRKDGMHFQLLSL